MKVRGRHAGYLLLLMGWLLSGGVGCGESLPDASERHKAIKQAVYQQDSLRAQRLLDSLQGRRPAATDSTAQDTVPAEAPTPVASPTREPVRAPSPPPSVSPANSSAAPAPVGSPSDSSAARPASPPPDTLLPIPIDSASPPQPATPTDSSVVPTPTAPGGTPSPAEPDTTDSFSPKQKENPI